MPNGDLSLTLPLTLTRSLPLPLPLTPTLNPNPGECTDCTAAHAALSVSGLTNGLTSLLKKRRAAFDSRLLSQLGLRGRPEREVAFASHALSALLGSMGFFYGSSSVAPPRRGPKGLRVRQTPPASLLAVVPSRPFFPRGFLWDEGFHQLVVGAWDPELADAILASWLGLMHTDGWIPREQILGAEAEARVPAEFMPQHRDQANPPALMLRIHSFLNSLPPELPELPAHRAAQVGEDPWVPTEPGSPAAQARTLSLLREMWPRLVKWHSWFLRTQAGERAHSFRWRGRDANDKKLNAMTLASGLDDYPRATTPSKAERHVDLHSWAAFFTKVLAQLAARLGLDEQAASYAAQRDVLLASLLEHHWSPEADAFCDWGQHANAGDFRPFYVVKCASADGASQVEHDILDPNRPDCPRSHPRFMFPLGDGQGGLLTRAHFVPRGTKEQFVQHLGYVSLFPLLLRLLPTDSPQLLPVIELLRDPHRLWSDHGLRSLSKADRLWYGRENAPGDAPYWRGPIWINLNYLALSGLHHYAALPGAAQSRAAAVYQELRSNLLSTMVDEYERTGYLWEQYDQDTGRGQRTHPFNGWSSLALLAVAERY